jgi:hypothetical protein
MTMNFGRNDEEYGLIGDIGKNIYDFIESGFDREFELNDPVNKKIVRATQYFNKTPRGFNVKSERLPFTIDVKEAGFDIKGKCANQPFVYFTRIDRSKLRDLVKNKEFSIQGSKYIVNQDDEKLIGLSDTRIRRDDGSIDLISKVRFLPSFEDYCNVDLALKGGDFIYQGGIFVPDKSLENLDSFTELSLKQEMRLELRQRILQDQSLKIANRLELRQVAKLAEKSRVLELSRAELEEKMNNALSDLQEDVQRKIGKI